MVLRLTLTVHSRLLSKACALHQAGDLKAGHGRGKGGFFAQLANGIDPIIGCSVDLDDIRMGSFGNAGALRADTTRFGSDASVTAQAFA